MVHLPRLPVDETVITAEGLQPRGGPGAEPGAASRSSSWANLSSLGLNLQHRICPLPFKYCLQKCMQNEGILCIRLRHEVLLLDQSISILSVKITAAAELSAPAPAPGPGPPSRGKIHVSDLPTWENVSLCEPSSPISPLSIIRLFVVCPLNS